LNVLNAWREARNILCVRLDNLGDVLMTTPAIRALKFAGNGDAGNGAAANSVAGSSGPMRRITLLASPAGAAAAAYSPEIDHAMACAVPWMKHASASSKSLLELRDRLEAARFDAAVIFTVYSQSPLPAAMLCFAAGIPLRLAHCRENPYHLLTDWVKEPEPGEVVRHETRRQLDLVKTIGAETADERLSFRVPAAAHTAVQRMLAELRVSPADTLVTLHPGASAASRRYSAERYAEVARRLLRAPGCSVAVTGDAGERALVEAVCHSADGLAAQGRIHNLAGRLALPELAALIQRSRVLISNNTGPAHLAAAVGTAVVDLYALTNPQHAPWRVPHRLLFRDVPCRYCYKSICPRGGNDCLDVDPAEVAAAAQALMAGRGGMGKALPQAGTGSAGAGSANSLPRVLHRMPPIPAQPPSTLDA